MNPQHIVFEDAFGAADFVDIANIRNVFPSTFKCCIIAGGATDSMLAVADALALAAVAGHAQKPQTSLNPKPLNPNH